MAWGGKGLGGYGTSCVHPQAVLKRGLKTGCTIIPLMKKDHKDNLEFFLSNVAKLHLAGWVLTRPRVLGTVMG